MSEVKRYNPELEKGIGLGLPCLSMLVNPYGEWVHYRDYAELKEQRDALAAENAALKTGVTYFACGSEYGFDLFRDKQAAIDVCLEEIDLHREGYLDGDGWDDGVRKTAWGVVIQSAQGRDAQGLHTSDSQHTYQTCNYQLEDEVKTPATDAYLNSVRAEGVEMLANEHQAIVAELNTECLFSGRESTHSVVVAAALRLAAQLRSGNVGKG